jgi:PilM
MSYAWFAIVLVLFGAVVSSTIGNEDSLIVGPRTVQTGQTAAATFLLYRNAVLNFLEANPGVPAASGAIPISSLVVPSGVSASAIPASASNFVLVGTEGERTVYIWQSPVAGIAEGLNTATAGDQSIGTDEAGTFVTLSGTNLDSVPIDIPSGDILSVVQLGG